MNKSVKSKRSIGVVYLQRITYFSVIPALLLSLKYRIFVSRMPSFPGIERRFERLKPYELFSRDEWLQLYDDGFDSWRASVFPSLQRNCRPPRIKAGLLSVDFSVHLWQLIGTEYECATHFISIARRHASVNKFSDYRIIEPHIYSVVEHGDGDAVSPVDARNHSIWSAVEWLNQWLVSGVHLAQFIVGTLRGIFLTSIDWGERPYLWRGISPREIPETDGRVDFAWAVHNGFIESNQAIYFLPKKASLTQRKYLHATGVAAVDPLDEYRLVGRIELLSCLLDTARGLLKALRWRFTLEGALFAQLIARGLIWGKIARAVSAKYYLTTTSACWPERAELAVLQSCGIRCITWAYSANSLTFAWSSRTFRDLGVGRSLLCTDEFWVWNSAFKRWLENRKVCHSLPSPAIKVVGPLMCGDARLMKATVESARSRLGLPVNQFIVGVFDMPAISPQWKQRHGGGPSMIESEYYAAFLQGILRILRELPDIAVLLKLKREVGDWTRVFPDELQQLLMLANESRDGNCRVYLVDVDVDPYLPIACSDMNIGMTYTSPVLAGLAMGKPGYYYDPNAIANWPSEQALRHITLQTSDALVDAVRRRGTSLTRNNLLDRITPPIPDPKILRKL